MGEMKTNSNSDWVRVVHLVIGLAATMVLAACGGSSGGTDSQAEPAFSTKELLGEALFSDVNLSQNRTQSCATCHNPDHAFVDNRLGDDGKVSAVSLGDDGFSLGDRNAPTAAYAMLSPDFDDDGVRVRENSTKGPYEGALGGQFLDGRESDLKGQAGGPPTNPIEMGMEDKASVVARLQENDDYITSFKLLYGDDVFGDADVAYAAMAESIAKFEKTSEFAPFDSKYDRFLKGEYVYPTNSKASLGKSLFFSKEFTNCSTCHQLKASRSEEEPFSSFEYHNIGVPVNAAVRQVNGKGGDFVDGGLFDHPDITDEAQKGKFKVPTLRNVTVTGPYMHNGVFSELETVIKFYDQFLAGSIHDLNPETGAAWAEAEVPETVNLDELVDGNPMTTEEVEAMVCFLATLTDERYESLIPADMVSDCGL